VDVTGVFLVDHEEEEERETPGEEEEEGGERAMPLKRSAELGNVNSTNK
jgi:hypothetical protein